MDLTNTIKVIQAPPAAPPAGGSTAGPGSASMGAPPVNADTLYSSGMRDKNGGSDDLALQGFNDYLRYFGNTEMAPNAQYYIGEIYYNRKDYDNAVKAFDTVLERYSENNKTLDAMYMKGRTLVLMGETTARAPTSFARCTTRVPVPSWVLSPKPSLRAWGYPSILPPRVPRASGTSSLHRPRPDFSSLPCVFLSNAPYLIGKPVILTGELIERGIRR